MTAVPAFRPLSPKPRGQVPSPSRIWTNPGPATSLLMLTQHQPVGCILLPAGRQSLLEQRTWKALRMSSFIISMYVW